MKYKERHNEIILQLNREKRVLVSDLSRQFKISEVTIRKDLDHLESMGILRRFHSGAVILDGSIAIDLSVQQKLVENRDLKTRIATCAAEMVGKNNSIILDAGSTTREIALQLKKRPGIKVVTNSLIVGSELADFEGDDLLLTGGTVRTKSRALVGPVALAALTRVRADIAFIGALGILPDHGYMSATILEAQVKQAMLRCAQRKIIVADHTKIGTSSFAPFAILKEADCLITTDGGDPQVLDQIRNLGIQLVIA